MQDTVQYNTDAQHVTHSSKMQYFAAMRIALILQPNIQQLLQHAVQHNTAAQDVTHSTIKKTAAQHATQCHGCMTTGLAMSR